MAKPRELYSGSAPQAMSMMGQGIADAYANAGRLEGQGYAALGAGIGQGLAKVGGAVGDYLKETKKIETQNKSFENLLNNDVGRAMFGFKSKEEVNAFLAASKEVGPKAQNEMFNTLLPNMMSQNMKMAAQSAQDSAAMERVRESGRTSMDIARMQFEAKNRPMPTFSVQLPENPFNPSSVGLASEEPAAPAKSGLYEFLISKGLSIKDLTEDLKSEYVKSPYFIQ
ncbi:hypothetical protein UFOVP742_42 [uncultured Caudovirales phage]|uniref:Uncharacterized protein n=1 Tax=uncultured Caudovirales phage TaxID=2100421 RepID=A0A6J7X5R0_9CAUD|nr:hypothetical protein UFOVP742_42 [uncultured Caudovirales phage]